MKKTYLNINGVKRMVMFDEEKDTLADVLRRIGLTGTKVGCGKGQCGACSVILNGKVTRSCITKMQTVEEDSHIKTIEGIGTPTNLHPLQQAWITGNGVQCGFCTPGFIVSAYGLLEENNHPTRKQVRDWFKKHHNVCRCTGYKTLVDSVMLAASVVRGEKTMADLQYVIAKDGSIYGTGYPRPSAIAKVTGTCDYGDDINVKLPGDALHLAIVMAKTHHAKIIKVDFSEAEKHPGFVQSITWKDVKGNNRISLPPGLARSLADGEERPIFAEDKVYRYGDLIAIIAARTREEAREAASKVKIEYEHLPAYLNALDAVADDALDIHDFPNLYAKQPLILGDSKQALEESDVIVENRYHTRRQPHLVIEPDTALSYIDDEGRVTVQSKCLDVAIASYSLPKALGIPAEKLRMIQNNTGASFGYAASPYMLGVMAVAAMATNRPCALTLSYEEHQHFTGKRMPSYSNMKLGANKDGKFTSMEVEVLYDNGAYTELTVGILKGMVFAGMPYFFKDATVLAKTAITNHNFTTAFRAFGSPQVYAGFEQLVDQMAEKLNIDPLELRRINVLKPGEMAKTGHLMEAYPMRTLIDNMEPRYLEKKKLAEQLSTPEKKRGVGVACGVYHASLGPADRSEAEVELNSDGTVTCYNTWSDQGQGGDVGALIHTHEALRPLGLTPDQIRLVMNDTATCPESGGAYSSRSNVMIGNAILDASKQLLRAMEKSDGTYRTYEEMLNEGIPTRYLGVFDLAGKANLTGLDPNDGHGNFFLMYTYGFFMAEVEVDLTTGKTTVLSMDMEDDVGVVTNPQSLEGQAYGGFAQGIGFALSEDYDDVKKHVNILQSGIPTIDMVPDELHVHHNVTPREHGPHGSGGAAELYLTSPHAAILNAIYNACGVRVNELPAKPEKILEGLRNISEGNEDSFVPYKLGPLTLHEEILEIKERPV